MSAAEQSLIGGLLLDSSRLHDIRRTLTVDDFERREHRLIFATIGAVHDSGQAVDILTVESVLAERGLLDAAGGLSYLGSLASNTPSAANVSSYAEIVKAEAIRRAISRIGKELAKPNGQEPLAFIESKRAELEQLSKRYKPVDQFPGVKRLVPVDLSDLEHCEADPTHFGIEKILPKKHVTLLSSHGGSGKTILAEIFAAHVACGMTWAGLKVEPSQVLFVSLEDPGDLARFRLRRICDEYGLAFDRVKENLSLRDGSNTDSVLAAEIAEAGVRHLVFTEAMTEIDTAAEGCGLVVIDNASDAFDADENSRRLVRAFIRELNHLARRRDCAVLLLAHIDKAAARHGAIGNTYSGSTSWHNTVRSRLALSGDEGLYLVQEKLNLGKPVERIGLEWSEHGVLVPIAETGTAALERSKDDDEIVLAAIRSAISSGQTVYPARTGPYSAHTILKTYPELSGAMEKDRKRFWAALGRLENSGRVVREVYQTPDRKQRERMVLRQSDARQSSAADCVRQSPIPPSATTARMDRADCADSRQSGNSRIGAIGALAHCPACNGEGCQWCRR